MFALGVLLVELLTLTTTPGGNPREPIARYVQRDFGSLTGALLAARRTSPRVRTVIVSTLALGVTTLVLALMPGYWTFAVATVPVGLSVLTLLTAANQTAASLAAELYL